eukprot:scaffold298412_cov22-Tisochrysis_lutea.AAC.1
MHIKFESGSLPTLGFPAMRAKLNSLAMHAPTHAHPYSMDAMHVPYSHMLTRQWSPYLAGPGQRWTRRRLLEGSEAVGG